MKISIIVPVYKVEKYIQRCFDSIKNQTYTNIECIFVDDCSPDNCYGILEQQIDEYSDPIDFKIIRHEQNKGLSGARNTGTFSATGEYIYYLDSDDEITHDCIDTLVKMAKKYPGVEMVQGNSKTIPDQETAWRDITRKNFPDYVNDNLWIKRHCLIKPRIPVNAWNKLIKKTFLLENHLFFKEGIIHEDEHWMFFVAKKLESIAFTKYYCYMHYVVLGSIMQSENNLRSLQSGIIILEDLSNNIDSTLSAVQRKYIYFRIKANMLRINPANEERKYISLYRSLINKNTKKAIRSLRIIDCLALGIFYMPYRIYSSHFCRMVTGILIRLI